MPQSVASASFKRPQTTIGDLDADTAARVMAASSDVAMVVDRDGVIRDVAVSSPNLSAEQFSSIVERRWVDTVALESRRKVEELLRMAQDGAAIQWREINHEFAGGGVPLKCIAVDAKGGRTIVLGRDLGPVAVLQQRLLHAQQTLERDYIKLRQAESRYRVLFQITTEAVIIVDQITKRVVEVNATAAQMIDATAPSLANQPFTRLFHETSREQAQLLLSDTAASPSAPPVKLRLADGRTELLATVSFFRHEDATHALVRLQPAQKGEAPQNEDPKRKLLRVLNKIPDAFVVTDESLTIIDSNLAFLEMTQLATNEAAHGEPLSRFIGRPGIDMAVLSSNLRDHGWVRNFATVLRTLYGSEEDVEISAVSVKEGLESYVGLIIRLQRREALTPSERFQELPRTAEQLTQLVGRASLKEIVGETTDVIEKMCIEAALNLTGNNRASAAEMLGLSRQGLYSKLNRYGLANFEPDTDERN